MNNRDNMVINAILESVENNMKDKRNLYRDLDESLKNKYLKVNKNEEKYIELLKFNIIYYKSIIKKMEAVLDVWIKNGIITTNESVTRYIDKINNSSLTYMKDAMKNGVDRLNKADLKVYKRYDEEKGIKRIEKVEGDYKALNLYKDIIANILTEVSSHPQEYKNILDFNTEELKYALLDGIFNLIDSILYNEEAKYVKFEDEPLVSDEDITRLCIEDNDNCVSFQKYISMISNPEVSVKINDCYQEAMDAEELEPDDMYLFSTDMKKYVSCVVLLMDYLPDNSKQYFKNLFRLFAIGKIDEDGFKDLTERYIRENTFLDVKTWYECVKIVISDFNIGNNKFFGEKLASNIPAIDLNTEDLIKLLTTLKGDEKIEDALEYTMAKSNLESGYKEGFNKFTSKIAEKFNKISSNLKSDEEKSEEDYDSIYEEYDDEDYEEYDDEDYDEYDDSDEESGKFFNKIKRFFNKDASFDEDEDYDDSEEYEDESIEPERFYGETSRQQFEAMEILKKREKIIRRENKITQKEYDKLKDERYLAEEINKSGGYTYLNQFGLDIDPKDLAYKKGTEHPTHVDSDDVFDITIDGKINTLDISEVNEEVEKSHKSLEGTLKTIEDKMSESDDKKETSSSYDEEFKIRLGKTQRLNADKIRRATDKTTIIELVSIQEESKNDSENIDNNNLDDEVKNIDAIEEVISIEREESNIASDEQKHDEEIQKTENYSEINENLSHDDYLKEFKETIANFESATSKIIEESAKSLETPEEENMNMEYGVNDYEPTIFEELEAMKSMKTEGIKISPVSNRKTSKVDLSAFARKREQEENQQIDDIDEIDIEDSGFGKLSDIKDSIKSKLNKVSTSISEDDGYTKKKLVRDVSIVAVLAIVIFAGYVYIIKSFNSPTVEETNKKTQIEASNKRKDAKESKGTEPAKDNSTANNKTTTEISQQTEEEKAKEKAESLASQKDREAEALKGGKGIYYTVFVGATKSKDGADSVANNFARRGINAEVIRNGGYYMLKVGSYPNYNQALAESRRISAKGVQNYIASRNKYFELKIEALKERAPYLSKDQLSTDYNDIKNQISATGKNTQYLKNLDEVYNEAINGGANQ